MVKCENCYHRKICINGANYKNAENCRRYKDKSLIVEMPYRINGILWQHSPITGEPVSSFQLSDIHWIIVDSDEIGKTVFISREEAERAFRESEK